MSTIPSPRYYVYILCRPNKQYPGGKPFYVGKGKGPRVFRHEDEARRGHKCHKCNVIRKVLKQGGEIQRYIVFTTDDEQEAFDYERDLIALYGRKTLCNLTDGGDGKHNPSAESRARQRAAIQVTNGTPEARERSSVASKKRWSDPDAHTQQSETSRAIWADPDLRARQSVTSTKNQSGPEYRARMSEAVKAAHSTPEYRTKRSKIAKECQSSAEYRARRSAIATANQADPEYRARMSASCKAAWARKKAAKESKEDLR